MQQVTEKTRYQQISKILKGEIAAGFYASGGQLPTEKVLSSQFQVNRHTIREAIRELKNDGLIYSVRGKGNFVTTSKIIYPLSDKVRFTQNILEANLTPGSRLLCLNEFAASDEIAGKLKLKDSETVLRLDILRTVDNIPFSIATSYLPAQRFQGLERLISGSFSLYALLKEHYQVEPSRQESVIEAKLPKTKEVQLLQIPTRQPLLVSKSLACDQDLAPVEYVVTRTRGDLGSLSINFNKLEQKRVPSGE